MGGVYPKAHNPEKLTAWYQKHLGLERLQGLIFKVDDLDETLRTLMLEGVTVPDPIEENVHGRFAWILDPEGNKIELWEPLPFEGKTLVNFPEPD